MSKPASPVTLPHRPKSVVHHGKNVEEANAESSRPGSSSGLERRDSLEGTKEFYGLHRTPSMSSRDASASLRLQNLRGERTRSESRMSTFTKASTNRPTSPEGSVRSPSRPGTAIPTPRAFLSPKKPAAAIRLERQERDRGRGGSARGRLQTLGSPIAESSKMAVSKSADQHAVTNDISSPPPVPRRGSVPDNPKNLIDFSPSPPNPQPQPDVGSHLSKGSVGPMGENTFKPDLSLRQSMTDISTPRQIHRELSSDDLVSNGRTTTSEKTNGHPPLPSYPSPPDRYLTKRVSPNRTAESGRAVTQGRRFKKYTRFENDQTTFFCGGHLMTGGDNPLSAIAVVVVIQGLTGVWLGTTGVWLWQHGREYGLVKGGGVAIVIILVYQFGIAFSSLLAAAFRDPGILPRNLDPDPPISQVESWWEADNRELTVKDGKVTVKYCETCKTYRPPRASHCRLCGNCVDGIDHHCSYIHNCVGKRNYLPFLVLLISAAIADIYIVVFSAIHFSLLCHHDHISFVQALKDSPGAAVSFLLGILCLPPVFFLLWYHARLLAYNLTTVEQIRASASTNLFVARKRPDNPFSTNSRLGDILIASLGRPQLPSWIDAAGSTREDHREVNPALTDPKWIQRGG